MNKSYEIWDMPNRCQVIVWRKTKDNMVKILRWLSSRYDEKGKFETFNFEELHRNVGINNKQVAYCCRLLAFKKDPFLRINIGEVKSKKNAKCGIKPYCKVKLLKPLLSVSTR